MTTFKIDQPSHPLHGREFPEYTAFARYKGGVEWIPLLIGEKQVRFFALCNLREVEAPKTISDAKLLEALAIGLAEVRKTPEAAPAYRPAWEVNPRSIVLYVAPKPLVVKMPRDLMGHIREALYMELKAA